MEKEGRLSGFTTRRRDGGFKGEEAVPPFSRGGGVPYFLFRYVLPHCGRVLLLI